MGKLPKEFTQVSPDPALETAIRDGNQGATGKASFAHLNELRKTFVLTFHADNTTAIAAGLDPGDLYSTPAGDVRVVIL